jgi:hypothetical protein
MHERILKPNKIISLPFRHTQSNDHECLGLCHLHTLGQACCHGEPEEERRKTALMPLQNGLLNQIRL